MRRDARAPRVRRRWHVMLLLQAVARHAPNTGRRSILSASAFSRPSGLTRGAPVALRRQRALAIAGADRFSGGVGVPRLDRRTRSDAVVADAGLVRDDELWSQFPFPLDAWQLSAGESILAGSNVIVCAPTGAGKTVVGEMALRVALQRGKRAIYTTPLKALSNQKFGEMRSAFGVERVGLATGDVSIRRGADVTVMTTEVYRNMASRASSLSAGAGANGVGADDELSSNSIVVLDEFHYLGDRGRGSTWEECVIFNPSHTQIVGLSATLPNAHRLASWIQDVTGRECVLVEAGGGRPVPLRYYFATGREFSPLFRDEEAGPGAFRGLLGLRGDGSPPSLKRSKKKRAGFGKGGLSLPGVDRDGRPQGLDLHPSLQSAAERRLASIDRRLRRIVERERHNDLDGHGGGMAIGAREQRKMKENMLKAELRKSVPSIASLLRRVRERDLLPAIFFIFSRKGCDNAAEVLCESFRKANSRKPASEDRRSKTGKTAKGRERGRSRNPPDENERELGEDELALVQDLEGRNFRAELLDQLLSDELDGPSGRDFAVGVEGDSFLSDANIQYYADIGLLDFEETKEVASRVFRFNAENPEIAFDDAIVEQLLCGVGSHHAGILPAHKAFVETLFRRELMKAIFATETLAAGINMPARTTVICSMAKRGDRGMETLETRNALQMAGRAGRRGMDVEGACVIAATPFEGPEDAVAIMTSEVEPISSQFSPSYALAVNLVERGSGRLDAARNMVERSFAAWEGRQREKELRTALEEIDSEGAHLLPEELFLNVLQLTLEKELMEARDGTSRTGTSQSKISKLVALVDVLADGKRLKKISRRFSGAVQVLELEQSTLDHLERELQEMVEVSLDPDLPPELFDSDKMELKAEISTQQQRVVKGEREVKNNILSVITKVVNNRIRDEDDDALAKALLSARMCEEEPTPHEQAFIEPAELNSYIKKCPKSRRRYLLDQTNSATSEAKEDDSWTQMLALINILEAYGCLTPASESEEGTEAWNVTSGGNSVGCLGMDNSLWQLCALGGAWDIAYESAELDKFEQALADFEAGDSDQEKDEPSNIPKPQIEAEALTNDLCQLSSSEMAGYVSSLVVDAPRRSDSALESFHKLSHPQQRVVQGALLSLERLVTVQRMKGLDDSIGKCQLELSACNVVTAWASGCSWNDAVTMSGAAPGDLVRTLSRVLDALRQLGNLPYQPARARSGAACLEASGIHPSIRALCREAANEMDRYPVKDMLPFEEDEQSQLDALADAESM